MIFADKLIQLRKKSGWTQEELAGQMNVTRQSVSKWEGAQSVPDLEKIIKLSSLFGVSTDYLLKDEIEEEAGIHIADDSVEKLRKLSLEEANTFLSIKEKTSKSTAFAVFLFILSPMVLMNLTVMGEYNMYHLSENMGAGIGLIVLFIVVAIGVGMIILDSSKLSDFKYLENELFEAEYGVIGMVKEKKNRYKNTYIKNNIIGVSLCILGVIPLFIALILDENNDVLMVNMLSITLFIAAIGVFMIVQTGSIWGGFQQVLEEGNYTKKNKERKGLFAAIEGAYWTAIVAIFLGYSFYTNDWGRSWIIWPVAGLLFASMIYFINIFKGKKTDTH